MGTSDRSADERVARAVGYLESLSPQALTRLREIYVDEATLHNPLHEAASRCEIAQAYERLLGAVAALRLVVHEAVVDGDRCFLSWDCNLRWRRSAREPITVRGATQLRFAPDGRIAMQRDYWDAAGELYEKLPLIGAPMRWLRRRLSA